MLKPHIIHLSPGDDAAHWECRPELLELAREIQRQNAEIQRQNALLATALFSPLYIISRPGDLDPTPS